MKKIVVIVALITLFSSTLTGQVSVQLENLGNFDKSGNGFGWYSSAGRNIDFNPETGSLCSVYRKHFSSEITGKIGAAVKHEGETDFELMILLNDSSEPYAIPPGGRYPHTVACKDYFFTFYNDYLSDGEHSNALISIYDNISNEWLSLDGHKYSKITAQNGVKPSGAWKAEGDVVYDNEAGRYHIISLWEVYGLNILGRKQGIMLGTSVDNTANEFVWTDINDCLFDNTSAEMSAVHDFGSMRGRWGQNGFGVVWSMNSAVTDTSNWTPSYLYTLDYGQNWLGSNASDNPFLVIDTQEIFDWSGEEYIDDQENIHQLDKPLLYPVSDAIITENNEIHMFLKVSGGSTTYDGVIDFSESGKVISGYYEIVGNLQEENLVWDKNKTSMLSTFVGVGTDKLQKYQKREYYNLKAGYAGDGYIYCSWLDRAEENPQRTPFEEDVYRYNDDAYLAFSSNYGQSWNNQNYNFTADNGNSYTTAIGINITNTPDICDQGWGISKKGEILNGNLIFYAASQYANLDIPALGEPESFEDYMQDLYAWKIELSGSGIETNNTISNFKLLQNYPNPFNPTTTINYELQIADFVNIVVFNAEGKKVWERGNKREEAGKYSISFDGTNFNSGIYFYALKINGIIKEQKKMVMIK